MNDYEKDAFVIKKMIGVVHPDYLVNSIAVFLKERDSKQLHKPDVMRSVCCGADFTKMDDYGYNECVECGKTFRQQTDA